MARPMWSRGDGVTVVQVRAASSRVAGDGGKRLITGGLQQEENAPWWLWAQRLLTMEVSKPQMGGVEGLVENTREESGRIRESLL